MNVDEYRSLDAIAIAALIRKGEISATEAAQAALEVASQWEPSSVPSICPTSRKRSGA